MICESCGKPLRDGILLRPIPCLCETEESEEKPEGKFRKLAQIFLGMAIGYLAMGAVHHLYQTIWGSI
jgi:hypothetical protein